MFFHKASQSRWALINLGWCIVKFVHFPCWHPSSKVQISLIVHHPDLRQKHPQFEAELSFSKRLKQFSVCPMLFYPRRVHGRVPGIMLVVTPFLFILGKSVLLKDSLERTTPFYNCTEERVNCFSFFNLLLHVAWGHRFLKTNSERKIHRKKRSPFFELVKGKLIPFSFPKHAWKGRS